ncbi:hypothetical protein QBC34DRAFT_401931 [Podospora aff. communis PSN243]|uniref:Fungal N-terminal domain-containing protein n=1 Tax=Podospora aff. communis PSN243 TaxID=3040156 RepID=A0AAV9GSM4_9PEZI|nr:hypothetical protein QBC34DRAFT_401931 [Podospora aff. communis PSN243]
MDPVSGLGLGSAIVTLVGLAVKIGKRTAELKTLAVDLPPDLQSAKDLVDLMASSCERLKQRMSVHESSSGIQTLFSRDLEAALTQSIQV